MHDKQSICSLAVTLPTESRPTGSEVEKRGGGGGGGGRGGGGGGGRWSSV